MSLRRQRLIAFTAALLAVWMLALAPTVSRLLASGRGLPTLIEICSSQGSTWVSAAQAGESGPAKSLPSWSEACDYCPLQAQLSGLPPTAPRWHLAPLGPDMPLAFAHAPRLLAVWRTALSRGPPLPL
jgi:hypothetical protein